MHCYRIILEEVLNPTTSKKYIDALAEKGWIHPNVDCRKNKEESYFLRLTTTTDNLGRIVAYLLENVGWCIVELESDKKTDNREKWKDLQTIIPF